MGKNVLCSDETKVELSGGKKGSERNTKRTPETEVKHGGGISVRGCYMELEARTRKS